MAESSGARRPRSIFFIGDPGTVDAYIRSKGLKAMYCVHIEDAERLKGAPLDTPIKAVGWLEKEHAELISELNLKGFAVSYAGDWVKRTEKQGT